MLKTTLIVLYLCCYHFLNALNRKSTQTNFVPETKQCTPFFECQSNSGEDIKLLNLVDPSKESRNDDYTDYYLNDEGTKWSVSENKLRRRKRATVGRNAKRLWTQYLEDGKYIIPYAIVSDFDKDQLNEIQTAITELEQASCIRFLRINDTNATKYSKKSYLEIKDVQGGGCHSSIGRRSRGKNVLKLEIRVTATLTCLKSHLILHELLHLTGLYHEHQRKDRGESITINLNLVQESRRNNFNIIENAETFGLPYDFDSLTNYKPNSFAINPEDIVISTPNALNQSKLGMQKHASVIDLLKVNLLYQCPGSNSMLEKFHRNELLTQWDVVKTLTKHMKHFIIKTMSGKKNTRENKKSKKFKKAIKALQQAMSTTSMNNDDTDACKKAIVDNEKKKGKQKPVRYKKKGKKGRLRSMKKRLRIKRRNKKTGKKLTKK